MTALANITIKKADGTTDVVYTATSASSGDKSPAVYQNRTVGTAPAHYPTLSIVASPSGNNGDIRRITETFRWPFTAVDVNGKTNIVRYLSRKTEYVIDQNIDSTDIEQFVKQSANLSDHADLVAQAIEGRAAT